MKLQLPMHELAQNPFKTALSFGSEATNWVPNAGKVLFKPVLSSLPSVTWCSVTREHEDKVLPRQAMTPAGEILPFLIFR